MNKNNNLYFVYYVCFCLILFLILFLLINNIKVKKHFTKTSSIIKVGENVNVVYPLFNSDTVNSIIRNDIYSYVKRFNNISNNDNYLRVNYELYYFDSYVNIVYMIDSNLYGERFRNIIIDLINKKQVYITNIFDKSFLLDSIREVVFYNYDYSVYSKITNSNLNNFTYIISPKYLTIYFYNYYDFGIKIRIK